MINVIHNSQVKSVRAEAIAFGILRSTLHDRLDRASDQTTAKQTTQRLTDEQERYLVVCIKELETQRNDPSRAMVRETASEILAPYEASGPLGNHWVERFARRYPEILSCIRLHRRLPGP